MKKIITLSLFLYLSIGISFSQEVKELDYNFVNTDLNEEEYNKVKLFFRYGNLFPVINVTISPNSKVLATLDTRGYIVIWDVNSRKQTMSIRGIGISRILFTPDGKYLIGAGHNSKELYYWDYNTGLVAFKKTLEFPITNMHISPDKTKLYTIGAKSGIQVRDLRNGDLIKKLKLGLTVGGTFAISPDGKYLVFGNSDEAAKASKVAASIVTGSDKKGFIQIRDFATGKNLKEFHVGKSGSNLFLQNVIFKKDKIIIIGNFEQANFFTFDLVKMKKSKIKAKVPLNIKTVELSADGKYFYLSTVKGKNKILVKFDAVTLKKITEYPISDDVRSIDFTRNGKFFVTGGGDKETGENIVRVWDYKTDKQLERFEGDIATIVSTAIIPNKKELAIGGTDGQLQIIDLSSGDISQTLNTGKGSVKVKISKNAKYIVTATVDYSTLIKWRYPSIVKIWNASTYELVDSIPDFSNIIISPDDKYIFASVGVVSTKMKLFEFESKSVIREDKILGSFTTIGFTNDGNILTQSGKTFKIRDTKKFKKISVGDKHKEYKGNLVNVHFNKDKTKIIGVISSVRKFTAAIIEWNMDGSINRVIYQNPKAFITKAIKHPTKDRIICNLNGVVTIIDEKDGKIIAQYPGAGFPLEYTQDEKHIIAFTDEFNKGLSFIDAKTLKSKLSYIKVNGKDGCAFYTEDFYYKVTKNAKNAISFMKSGKIYPFEQFDLKYNRPDIIAENMPYPDDELIKMYKKAYKKRLQKMNISEDMLKADFDIPILEITKEIPISSSNKSIDFSISITSKIELTKLKIWVNDVPIYNPIEYNLKNSKELKKDINIELSEGKNKIQIAVLNKNGIESAKETRYIEYTGTKTKHDLYIVAIGVSNYKDSEYNLTYAAKDVNDFVNFMSKQNKAFNNINVYKFIDADATVKNIMKVKEELKKSQVDDEVVVYFAGHGLLNKDLDYYLAMNNVNFLKPEVNGLSIDDFESLVDGIPSRKKSMFIDACHSGEVDKEEILNIKENIKQSDSPIVFRGNGVPKSNKVSRTNSNLKNSFELMKETFADLRRGSGAMIISSAGGGEFALESDKWKNGVFTYSILEGLETGNADLNGDKTVSISELGVYVSNNVRKLTYGQQNPTFRRENLEFDYGFLNPEKTMINKNAEIVAVAAVVTSTDAATKRGGKNKKKKKTEEEIEETTEETVEVEKTIVAEETVEKEAVAEEVVTEEAVVEEEVTEEIVDKKAIAEEEQEKMRLEKEAAAKAQEDAAKADETAAKEKEAADAAKVQEEKEAAKAQEEKEAADKAAAKAKADKKAQEKLEKEKLEKAKKEKKAKEKEIAEASGERDAISIQALKYGFIGVDYEHLVSDNIGLMAGVGFFGVETSVKYHFKPQINSSSIGFKLGYRYQIIQEQNSFPRMGFYYEYRALNKFTFTTGFGFHSYSYEEYENGRIRKHTDVGLYLDLGVGIYFTR